MPILSNEQASLLFPQCLLSVPLSKEDKTQVRTIILACRKSTQMNLDTLTQASFPRHFRRKCMYIL